MRDFIKKIIFFSILFLVSALNVFAAEPLKIDSLLFDNSDNVIFIKTRGDIESAIVKKGYLNNPDRIYLDIENAALSGAKKTYGARGSKFNFIKISQFQTAPNIVRIVFECPKKPDLSMFQVYKNNFGIYIKTKNKTLDTKRLKIVYSSPKSGDRSIYYNGAKFEETMPAMAQDLLFQNEITKDIKKPVSVSKIASNFYVNSIVQTKNGILINGLGKLSLVPAFSLSEPTRLIIDLDDTIVSPELRGKTFQISEKETLKIGQNSQSLARVVIQGENAKEYRAIISPDSKNLFLTNRKNIINSTITDTNINLKKTSYSSTQDTETINFQFDDSAALSVFEENSNLYIDIHNLNIFENGILDPITRALPNFKTVRIAADKLRIIFPAQNKRYLSVKTSPDNDEIRVYSIKKQQKPASVYTPIQDIKTQPEILNLFTVVIDAGHGGQDVGATRENIYEKDITLDVAKMVQKNLSKKKVRVYMVRSKDETVSLAERSNFSNEKKPDVFVSIHVNSSTNDDSKGVETHWYKEDSYKYAKTVHLEFSKKIPRWQTNDRGLFQSKFYVINHTEAPAILCEIGFISNQKERTELTTKKRQEEIAEAISTGIYNYLKAKK